jgi:hypothetical protein
LDEIFPQPLNLSGLATSLHSLSEIQIKYMSEVD